MIKNKRVVMVGTGRLLGDTDITNAAVQSVYAMVDNGTRGTADHTAAHQAHAARR